MENQTRNRLPAQGPGVCVVNSTEENKGYKETEVKSQSHELAKYFKPEKEE